MLLRRLAAVLWMLAWGTGVAGAWNLDGHRIVAQIAAAEVDAETRGQLEALFGQSVGQALPAQAGWADSLTSSRPETRPWHYVNIPRRADGFDWRRDCPEGACIVGALTAQYARLRNPDSTAAQRREAVAFLVHFVADLHQPLHCGDGQDRGGNDIAIVIGNRRSNLHRVWDGEEFPWPQWEGGEWAPEALEAVSAPEAFVRWADESHRLAVEYIYASLPPALPDRSVRLTPAHLHDYWQLARARLRVAGTRLAQVLDAAFADR